MTLTWKSPAVPNRSKAQSTWPPMPRPSPRAPRGHKGAGHPHIGVCGEDGGPPAWRAEVFLHQIAADKAPPTPGKTDKANRRKSREVWEGWWQKNASRVDLTKLQVGKAL